MIDYKEAALKYKGKNPHINNIKKKFQEIANYQISEFDIEYMERNYLLKPYTFDMISFDVSHETNTMLKLHYKTDREFTKVKFDTILGETKEWYHVSCPRKNSNATHFWINKKDTGDLYEKIYTRYQVDFDKLNAQFNDKKLYKHQETGVQFLLYNKKCFLLDTGGAGKTYTSIAASVLVAKKTLIISIAGMQIKWQREISDFNKESKIIWGEDGWIEDDVPYTIIGCDVLKNYDFKYENYDCIIIDEVHKFKNTRSKRSKALQKITSFPSVKYVWGMSATLIEKNEEFYNVCTNLNISVTDLVYAPADYHYLESKTIFEKFLFRYCKGRKIPARGKIKKAFILRGGNSNTIELHQRSKHIQRRRVTSKVVEGFPNLEQYRLFFRLSRTERRKYDKLFDEYLEAKKKELTGKEDEIEKYEKIRSLIETSKMSQYLAIKKIKHTAKFIKSEVDDGNNILIFTNYIEEFEKIVKKMGVKAIAVKSGLTKEKRTAIIDEYMTNDKIKILVGNTKSIGVGQDIQKADIIWWNTLPWESDYVEQGNWRSWRIGRKGDVRAYYPLFEATIEETLIYPKVVAKSLNRAIFQGEDTSAFDEE